MKGKQIFLICNAHIDPVWQWEWEEGAAEAISTFRVAAQFCEDYDSFVFNHNEALLYQWIEEYEPELFEKIKTLVQKGKWHIMGGWQLQPDCNMPSGEAFVRQILYGRRYFYEKFRAVPTTAINFDPFGHSRGLVQIMRKSGFDSYLFGRPSDKFLKLPSDDFRWIGFDGSSVMAKRFPNSSYNSGFGKSVEKIKLFVENCPDNGFDACLWGVGNHGGGPSRIDLDNISVYQQELAKENVELIHATPEMYFEEVKKSGKHLPEHSGDLNMWAVGCYTSQIKLKQKYRELENMYFMTEKMCTFASEQGLLKYPERELQDALYDMLMVQFHDALPGTSIQPVEEMSLRVLHHGLEILSRVKARAFFALSQGQEKAELGTYPILVFNPHPYPVEDDFICEFMLADQNWNDEFSNPVVYKNGERLVSQCEKEHSNLPLDWRKRVVFHARLEPMSMNRFDCVMEVLPKKPIPTADSNETHYIIKNDRLLIEINKNTGLIDRYNVDGADYLKENAFALNVVKDNYDPWGMTVTSFPEMESEFTLMPAEQGSKLSALGNVIPSVRVIEDGELRTVVEAVFGYNNSYAVVNYKIPKNSVRIEISVRVVWVEAEKMIKMAVPASFRIDECLGETAYGEQRLRLGGDENVSQKYIVASDGESAFSVINDGIYGSSCIDNVLYLTLLRSAGYTAHPIDDRTVLPQDRYSAHMEQGERLFNFVFEAGEARAIKQQTPRNALIYAEKPMCLSLYPSGKGEKAHGGLKLTGDNEVIMTAYKKQEKGEDRVIRLFNSSSDRKQACLNGVYNVDFGPYEIKTILLSRGEFSEYQLLENIIDNK